MDLLNSDISSREHEVMASIGRLLEDQTDNHEHGVEICEQIYAFMNSLTDLDGAMFDYMYEIK